MTIGRSVRSSYPDAKISSQTPATTPASPTHQPDETSRLVGKEMYVCIGGDVSEIPYMYAVAWRDGGFEGFRALTCTFTVPLVLAPCWICWITRPDLHKHWRPRGGCPA